MPIHITPEGDGVEIPANGIPREDIASQTNQAGFIDPQDNPEGGEFFYEPAEEQVPEGDRLERLSNLATQLREAQFEIGRIEDLLEVAINNERKIREEYIPNLMKEVTMKQLTLEDGVKLEVLDDFRCGISESHKPLALKWLRDNGLGGIIKRVVGVQFGKGDDELAAALRETLTKAGYIVDDAEAVHYQTLRATIAEEREQAKAVPADLFSIFDFQTTKLKFPRGMVPPPKPKFAKKPKK